MSVRMARRQRKLPQVSAPSLAEHINCERERLFKAMSIIACCRLACASKLDANPEIMTDALQAAYDLVSATAGALELIDADVPAGARARSSATRGRMMDVAASELFMEINPQP